MTINKMEMIDAQCLDFYGHTNWVFLSTLSEDVIEETLRADEGEIGGAIMFFFKSEMEVK